MPEPSRKTEIDAMVLDPADHFAAPMDVVKDSRLTRADKKRVLEAWIKDAELLSVAEAENMQGGKRPRLREAHLAMEALEEQP